MITFRKFQLDMTCDMIDIVVKLSDHNDESEIYSSIFNILIMFERDFAISLESIESIFIEL